MSKKNQQSATVESTPATVEAPAINYTLVYRRDHPQNRSSYGIAGVPGIVVFDKSLFADGNPPSTIILDCAMAQPKPDRKIERAAEQARKLEERAAKAQARILEAQAKATERAAKAQERLEKAKAKVEAATTTTASA